MPVTHRCRRVGLLLAAAATLGGRMALAQDSTCTYDRCALRLQHSLFSVRVVQGASATSVARLGLFAPRIEPLSTGRDSVRRHYEAFRSSRNRAGAFTLAGLSVWLASVVVYESNTRANAGVALGLTALAVPFVIAGGVNDVKARNHLEQAIWFYNRALPRAP